jgi:hypothetical protein
MNTSDRWHRAEQAPVLPWVLGRPRSLRGFGSPVRGGELAIDQQRLRRSAWHTQLWVTRQEAAETIDLKIDLVNDTASRIGDVETDPVPGRTCTGVIPITGGRTRSSGRGPLLECDRAFGRGVTVRGVRVGLSKTTAVRYGGAHGDTDMKRTFALLLILLLAAAAAAAAPKPAVKKSSNGIRPGLFELGVYLGQPTGISAKYWINGKNSIDGVAAWGFGGAGSGNLVVAADYLFNFIDMVQIEKETFPLYVGAGAIMSIDMGGGISLGARIPLGALYIFRDVPLEISLEIVPGLYLVPATSFSMMGGIGVRYCF